MKLDVSGFTCEIADRLRLLGRKRNFSLLQDLITTKGTITLCDISAAILYKLAHSYLNTFNIIQ